jgi:hypothetical protein
MKQLVLRKQQRAVTRLSRKSATILLNRRQTRLSPQGIHAKRKSTEDANFVPCTQEAFYAMQRRASLKLKFKKRIGDAQIFTIDAVKRVHLEIERPNDFDFYVTCESRGLFYTFPWEEMVTFYFIVAPYEFTPHECELLDPDHHYSATAQLRSEYNAEHVFKVVRFHEKRTHQPGFVFTLDGRLRNSDALVLAGVPKRQVIVIEREPIVALFQKLLAQLPSRNVNVFYSGEYQDSQDGFQGFFLNNLFPRFLDANVLANTVAVYADFCGDIPSNLQMTLERMPNLQLFGVTQSVRNTCGKVPQLKQFQLIREFPPDKVRCSFYSKTNYCNSSNSKIDNVHAFHKIAKHRVDSKKKTIFLIYWRDGTKTWENENNLDENDIQDYYDNITH